MQVNTVKIQQGMEWWTHRADVTERLRKAVWLLPVIGLIAAALLQALHPLWSGLAMTGATLAFLWGMRRTSLQRLESEAHLQSARQQLRQAQGELEPRALRRAAERRW